jgi:hypothetical protein
LKVRKRKGEERGGYLAVVLDSADFDGAELGGLCGKCGDGCCEDGGEESEDCWELHFVGCLALKLKDDGGDGA